MKNIDNIIDRYLAGETSLEEEGQIKAYLLSDQVDDQHKDLIPLFQYFDLASTVDLDKNVDVAIHAQNAGVLIDKYWTGNTSLTEEKLIKEYLLSKEVAPEHQDMIAMFAFFEEQESAMMSKFIDVSAITGEHLSELELAIESYWSGESTIEQEAMISEYVASGQVSTNHSELIPLFSYFAQEKDISLDNDLGLDKIAKQPEAKVRFMFPKVMAVAASLALLLMFTFNFMSSETSYKNTYTEVEDPEEALEITMEALAFLGHKYDKGTKPIKYIKELEKTDVFRFTK